MKLFFGIVASALVFSGCAGPTETRTVLANPEDGKIVRWESPRFPSTGQVSAVDEILKTGVIHVVVGRALIPVRHWDVARYRSETNNFYFGTSAFARSLLLPLYLAIIVPFDILLSGLHGGPFPFAHMIFALDEEWIAVPGFEERADVTRWDNCGPGRFEPMAGERCDLVVKEGSAAPNRARFLAAIRTLSATSAEGGACDFDLRPLAHATGDRDTGWTLTIELFPGGYTNSAAPLILTAEQVRRLAELK